MSLNMQTFKYKALILVLLWLNPTWLSADPLPETLELIYEVSFGVAELGSLRTLLTKQETHYEAVSETRAEGMASILLGGKVREICQFSIADNAVRPDNYRIIREGEEEFDYSVSFNWDERRVIFNNGNNVVIANGYIVDNCSAPFAFILGGAEVLKRTSLHIVGGKKVRRFENNAVDNELVSTPLGEFNAVKIEQVRFDRPDRKLMIWLAPERNNLPIKIVEQRNSRPDTTMLLTSVDGL